MNSGDLKVICGPACAPTLVSSIQYHLQNMLGNEGFRLTHVVTHCFEDGEFLPQITENVRGADVYVVQPAPARNENLKHLELVLNAAALASAGSVTAIVPYLEGLRQDRKDRSRVGITAKLVVTRIERAMSVASRRHIIFFHPHFSQIQGFLEISTSDILYPTVAWRAYLEKMDFDFSRVKVVSPDQGAAKLAILYARLLDLGSISVAIKERVNKDKVRIVDIVGDVAGKIPFIFDDIVDTAGTLSELSLELKKRKAETPFAFITHPVLAGKAIPRLQSANFEKIVVTNSIDHDSDNLPGNLFKIVDCGGLFAEAIYRTHTGKSISEISGMFLP